MARLKISFISYSLNREVDLTVVLPSISCPDAMMNKHHEADPEYPVLYLLHGYGNNHNGWTAYTNVEYFAEEHNVAVVMMSGENKSYYNHGTEDRFFDFISEELPEYIESILPVSKKPENKYIAGLSMGGYGALLHGLSNSQNYAAIGAFSAAVAPLNTGRKDDPMAAATDVVEGFEPATQNVMSDEEYAKLDLRLLAEKAVEEDRKIPVYMAVGDQDFLLGADTEFKDFLVEKGFDVTWDVIPGYGHEWRFWNIQIEKFLDWIPRTDKYFKEYGPKRGI